MFCDYHVHTYYSDDSDYKMENVIKDAIRLGIDEICFTDHVDYGIKKDRDENCDVIYRDNNPLFNVNYPCYIREIQNLKKRYPQISIKIGLEFGVQTHTIMQFKKLFQKYSLDFIILSCHQIEDKELWTQDFQREKTQDQYQLQYYQEILNVIQQYKDYSVIGHLDLINRYDQNGEYPFEKIKGIVTKILKQVIVDGKGIEINTSSHRYGLNDLMPSLDILKLYKDLGGKIITIGSDSHQKEHLGTYIQETKKILKELGFEYYCTFEKMEPIFHFLDVD